MRLRGEFHLRHLDLMPARSVESDRGLGSSPLQLCRFPLGRMRKGFEDSPGNAILRTYH